MKYHINKEFFPYSHFTPLIKNAKMASKLNKFLKVPRWVRKNKDKDVLITKECIKSFDNDNLELLVFSPKSIKKQSPCLVYYHGGGFFFSGAWYHYRLAQQYAIATSCKVVFVQYRLAPKYPYPTPVEDCYSALNWVYENASKLNIDKRKIAVGGDSAGGSLAGAVCQMARDRKTNLPLFQLLIYPVTDRRMQTESYKKYTNTPMWNSKLSAKMWQGYLPDEKIENISYASIIEAKSFGNLPPAYIETAEFDCLHDEAIDYAKALIASGVSVLLNETKGTMHGFDIAKKSKTTSEAINARVLFMKNMFFNSNK